MDLTRATLISTCGQPDSGNVVVLTSPRTPHSRSNEAMNMASMVKMLVGAGVPPSQSQSSLWVQNPENPNKPCRIPAKPGIRVIQSASTLTPQQPQPAREVVKLPHEPTTATDEETDKISSEDESEDGGVSLQIPQSSTLSVPYASVTNDDDGIPIPGTRGKKMWPFLPVCSSIWSTKQYEERFGYIVLQLRRVVGSDAILRTRSQFIDYDLTMAGQTAASASPSICIKCKKIDVKPLRKLFDETAGARLYCYRESRFKELFPNWHTSKPPAKPPFKLVYFPSKSNPTKKNASDEDLMLHSRYKDTMCGAIVEFKGRHATIGLTIQIGEVDWLLTVEHLFREALKCVPGPGSSSRYDVGAALGNSSSGPENLPLWANDSDDDSFASEEWSDSDEDSSLEDVKSHTEAKGSDFAGVLSESNSSKTGEAMSCGPENQHIGSSSLPIPFVDEASSISRTFRLSDVQPETRLNKLTSSSPFLDWVCLRTGSDLGFENLRQNLITVARDRPSVLLKDIAEEPNKLETPVYVVSGKLGIRSGTLIGRFSYLGSPFGMDMAKVWTVILDTSRGVIAGECGSIVVDRETYQVYGHVIGSDVLGHARVAPLAYVVEQIKTSFGRSEVFLPDYAHMTEASGTTESIALKDLDLQDDQAQLNQLSSAPEDNSVAARPVSPSISESADSWESMSSVEFEISPQAPPQSTASNNLPYSSSSHEQDSGVPTGIVP